MEELARHTDTEDSAFLRVTLRCDGPRPGLADEVRERLPNALEVKLEFPRIAAETPITLRGLSPREQFASYYAGRHGAPASDEMLVLFDELIEEAAAS
jgi:hypothetical protein